MKYLRINLPKDTRDPYIETIKHSWKKSKMAHIDGETCHVYGLEESICENEYTN